MVSLVFVNGKPGDNVNVNDRAFNYGDGLFETMLFQVFEPKKAKDSKSDLNKELNEDLTGKRFTVPLLTKHQARLKRGLIQLDFNVSDEFYQSLWQHVQAIFHRTTLELEAGHYAVKLLVSRGESARGYGYSEVKQPNWLMKFSPLSFQKDNEDLGVKLNICKTPASINSKLAGLKHLNRLENVIARGEITYPFADGIMINEFGNVIETTMANLFFCQQNKVITPRINCSGVKGVMREQVIEWLVENNFSVEETDITIQQVVDSNGAFMTNGLIGLWPILSLTGEYNGNQIAKQFYSKSDLDPNISAPNSHFSLVLEMLKEKVAALRDSSSHP